MKKHDIHEHFSNVKKQKDVDRTDKCLVPKNDCFPKLSQINQKIENCFKDNNNIHGDLKNIEKYFAIFLTEVLLSDTLFLNVFNLSELQTNVKTFRVLIYTIFNNSKFIKKPTEHHFTKNKVKTVKEGLNMLKHILLFGYEEPINDFKYDGLKDLYDTYIQIFSGKDLNFEQVFRKVFVKNSNYKKDFEKHYKLTYKFKDLDGAIKKIQQKLEYINVVDDKLDIKSFNEAIHQTFKGQKTYDDLFPEVENQQTWDVTRQQGYYHLRVEIEMWKQLIKQNTGDKKKIAEEMLDYYDKGKNNRKEIFQKLVKKLYHDEEKNIFKIWDDSKKKYQTHAAMKLFGGNENYSNMRRIYYNIIMFSHLHQDLFELFDPNPSKEKTEKLVLRPECESMPEWDI